jgi:magnesium chelatase family protein
VSNARARLRERSPPFTPEGKGLLDRAVDRIPLSGRGRARVARVAASVAALAGAEHIEAEHVAEALSYRQPAELGSAA